MDLQYHVLVHRGTWDLVPRLTDANIVTCDNMQFVDEFTWLLMQIKALNIPFVCMLSYFN